MQIPSANCHFVWLCVIIQDVVAAVNIENGLTWYSSIKSYLWGITLNILSDTTMDARRNMSYITCKYWYISCLCVK